jgi:predicted Zn finger-like uncharacterized protein
MILTCPDCATSYFVDDGVIPDAGRTVRCASCGTKWKATPEAEPVDELEDFAPPLDDLVVEEAEAPAFAELPSEDDLEIVAGPAGERRAAPPKREARPVPRGLLVGAGIAAAVAVSAGAAAFFREQVAGAWPASAAAYAAVGLPVNQLGLVIEQVKFQPSFQGGRPVLSITGAIRNTRQEMALAPAIRISLLDKDGKPLFAKLARPLNAEVPGGASRYFAIALADPPAGLQELEVVFDTAVAPADAPGAAPHAEAVLQAEPMDAQPLPADSAHALPDQHG